MPISPKNCPFRPLSPKNAHFVFSTTAFTCSFFYVIPRLLFGLEVLPINQTQLNLLSKFHVNTLKRFQALPTRTTTCAVHLLLGALPIEAELHKRQLSLLYNILVSSNETITELSERQIAVNLDNPLNYFSRVQSVLGLVPVAYPK